MARINPLLQKKLLFELQPEPHRRSIPNLLREGISHEPSFHGIADLAGIKKTEQTLSRLSESSNLIL